MSVAYYVSAHGYGHFIRSAAVLRAMPREIPILLTTEISGPLVAQELKGVNFVHRNLAFDCGALGENSLNVEAEMTFRKATELQAQNDSRLKEEVDFLKREGVRLVVCDSPPFPMKIAHDAGLPSILIANFTWIEIYEALIQQARGKEDEKTAVLGEQVAETLRREFALGDLHLIPGMALRMNACKRQQQVPIISRRGSNQRARLCERLGLDPQKAIYLLYLGLDGYRGLDWNKLRDSGGAQFISFRAVNGSGSSIVHVLDESMIMHGDAAATADAVVGKLGYSLCAECAAAGTPMLFPPRNDFPEADILAKSMIDFGLGVPISDEAFRQLDWAEGLRQAAQLRATQAGPAALPDCTGSDVCAAIVARAWRDRAI